MPRPRVWMVKDVPLTAIFVVDSQEVKAIKEHLGKKAEEFSAFFVIVKDGDYEAVWGMEGIVPYLNKEVVKLV